MPAADRLPTAPAPEQVKFDMFGEVLPLHKAVGGRDGYVPTRPLGGWLATFGTIGPNGGILPVEDREGHVFEAAATLGRIDFSGYLRKGRWNDTHESIYVGVPSLLEFHDATTDLAKAHRKVGWWTEGHLFDRSDPRSWSLYTDYEPTAKDLERADYYWTLATMLKGMPRPLGFSAHGKMLLSPCGKRIIWAKVDENAVCEMPQNPTATAIPLRLAVPIRAGMVGANPCDNCRCPPGAKCPTLPSATLPLGKAVQTTVPAPQDLEARTGDESPSDTLIRLVCEQFGVDQQTARKWCSRWFKRNATSAPPQEGHRA